MNYGHSKIFISIPVFKTKCILVMIATARLTELPVMGLYPTLHIFPVTVKSGFIGILILPLFLLKLFSSCMYLKHFHQSLNVKQTLTNVE